MVSFGSILSLAGPVLGALGGGKNTGASQQQITGYQSLSKEIQDYLLKSMFPRIQSYGESSYQGLPMRRVNESDLDPVFGSKARQDLQAWRDYQMAQNAEAPMDDTSSKAAEMADMEARMMARQYFAGAGGTMANPASTRTAQSRMADMYGAGLFDDKGLSDIGRFVQASGGGTDVAGYDGANMKDPKLFEGFQGAQAAALLEAMKRKGMSA